MVEVNRSLPDPHMDDIDHALGRPVDPLGETTRNFYATELETGEGQRINGSAWWRRGRSIPGGLVYFHVTDAGKKVLADYLAAWDTEGRDYD